MMQDRRVSVSVTSTLAWLLWGSVVTCMVLGFVIHHDSVVHAFLVMALGLACSTAAATMHIRAMLCTFSRNMQQAFDLGREVEHEHQAQLRSVR